MNNEIEKITTNILQYNFDLPEIENGDQALQKIRLALIDKIEFLLDHDFERLLQILYLIDVNEDKAKTMLTQESIQKPSAALADLIIERMIEKAITRINNPVQRGDLNE